MTPTNSLAPQRRLFANGTSGIASRTCRAFTLIELLVVISVMAVLAAILLPAINAVRQEARVADTKALVKRVEMAIYEHRKNVGHYLPDHAPSSETYLSFHQGGAPLGPLQAFTPETLYYHLANPFVSAGSPYVSLRRGSETADYNHNGLHELIDSWGGPLLYNAPAIPGDSSTNYNYYGHPRHNTDSFDLFSLGPNRKTVGQGNPVDPANLASYCNIITNANAGNEEDDIRNW